MYQETVPSLMAGRTQLQHQPPQPPPQHNPLAALKHKHSGEYNGSPPFGR